MLLFNQIPNELLIQNQSNLHIMVNHLCCFHSSCNRFILDLDTILETVTYSDVQQMLHIVKCLTIKKNISMINSLSDHPVVNRCLTIDDCRGLMSDCS